MKLKLFLLVMGTIFLLLGTNVVSAGIWNDFLKLFSDEKTIEDVTNDDVFKELILNDVHNTDAIIVLKNPTELINIKREDIRVNFIEECGSVAVDDKGNKKYKLFVNSTCEAERIKEEIYGLKEVCYNKSIIDNKTFKNVTQQICYNESFIKEIIYENYTYFCFKEFTEIKAKDLIKLKIDVNKDDIIWNTCSDGSFGYKIDWQLEVILDDGIDKNILVKKDWEWWNESYPYSIEINISQDARLSANTSFAFKFVVNSSDIDYSHINDNGSDLRCINRFNITKALYRENWNKSGDSIFYCNFTASPDADVNGNRLYFGNTQAVDVSSFSDTFPDLYYFTSFNDNELDIAGNISISNQGADYSRQNDDLIERKYGRYGFVASNTDWMVATLPTAFDYDNDFSMSFWYNNPTGDSTYRTYIDTSNAFFTIGDYKTNADWGLWVSQSDQYLKSKTYYQGDMYVTVTHNSNGSFVLYVNGTEIDNIVEAYSGSAITDVTFGSNRNHDDKFHNSWMDEIRFYTRDLSLDEVKLHYNQPDYSLGTEEEPPSLQYILNGTIKDSNNVLVYNATIIIINQADNTITGTTTSNSTGGWNYTINVGTYLICAYDPNNSTRDGDADPHIIVS